MNRKGITPVIATVLLMTITVAATASAFTFMNGIQNDLKENTEDRLSQQERESQSNIDIETAYNSTDGYIIVSVRNTGSLTLQIRDETRLWSMFTNGSPVGDGTEWEYRNEERDYISPQQTVNLNTTEKFPDPGSDTLIKITGPNGVSDSKVCFNSGAASC